MCATHRYTVRRMRRVYTGTLVHYEQPLTLSGKETSGGMRRGIETLNPIA